MGFRKLKNKGMNKKLTIDQGIRNKLDSFEKTPPPGVWEALEKELAQKGKKRLLPLYMRYAAGITILIATALTFFYFNAPRPEISLLEPEGVQVQQEKQMDPATGHKDHPGLVPEPQTKSPLNNPPKSIQISSSPASKTPSAKALSRQEPELVGEASPANEIVFDKRSKIYPTPVTRNAQSGYLSQLPTQISAFVPSDRIIPAEAHTPVSFENLFLTKNETVTEKTGPEFILSGIASPLYSYRDIKNVNPAITEYFNNSEQGKINYSGGINFGIRAGKRLSFHSGILYSKTGISVNHLLAAAGTDYLNTETAAPHRNAYSLYLVGNSIGTIDRSVVSYRDQATPEYSSLNNQETDKDAVNYLNSQGQYDPSGVYSPQEGSVDQYFQYLEVPFLIKYVLIDRIVDLSLLGGISTNFLINSRVFYVNQNEKTELGSTAEIETLSYSGNFGLGLNYALSEKMFLSIEPQFKYYLNSVNPENLISTHPWTLGFYTGIRYDF